MPDPTTTNLQLAQPTRGSDSGTWDVPVNGNSGILDAVFGSITSKSLTNVTVNLTVTEAQVSVLSFSGSLSGNVTVHLPAIIKFWLVENKCTLNGFVVTLAATASASDLRVGLPPGDPVQVYSDGTNVKFVNLGRTGKEEFWYTSSLPAWVTACTVQPYLIMDGSSFSGSTYPALSEFLGSTTLPDFRGYVPAPLDNQGGSAAGRLTSTTMSPNGNTVGATGGTQTKTLITANLPAHSHPITDPGHKHGLSDDFGNHSLGGGSVSGVDNTSGTGLQTNTATTGITVGNTGSGTAFNGIQPTKIAGIFVMKT